MTKIWGRTWVTLLTLAVVSCGAASLNAPALPKTSAKLPASTASPTPEQSIAPVGDFKPTVILVSVDGFRHDYLSKYAPTNLKRIADQGVRAEALLPVFPTLTFPNHYSIVTGLLPDNHGITANDIRDPNLPGVTFSLGASSEITDDPRWWWGEPIWVTAEKQGQTAAAMFWPGSTAEIKGVRPTYYKKYDAKFPRDQRVQQVLDWLDLPLATRPTMITLYFEDVDSAGHGYGPDSTEVKKAIQEVDDAIGLLAKGLENRKLEDKVNLVFVSDHGMSAIDADKVIALDKYINLSDVEIISAGAFAQIFPKAGKLDAVFSALKDAHPHMAVYKNGNLPARYRYGKSVRTAPIICVPDEKFYISQSPRKPSAATHGYDNELAVMRGFFVARGPAFKSKYTSGAFSNLHIYALVSEILGLTPAKNDGDLNAVRSLLK
ncbi:MAG: ectonucleotide pyrophosphatase/phosphodiesterase [Bacteriovoracia bacterium]